MEAAKNVRQIRLIEWCDSMKSKRLKRRLRALHRELLAQ
jgi:hypothetical protein